jgi:undecaprenyl-diphosphatase
MDFIDSFLLGLLQGLTEFLPISSSGHLVLAKAFLSQDLQQGITFEVVVHFGTLCSILVYYRETIADILSSLFRFLTSPAQFKTLARTDYNIKLSGYILLSMIPALVVGLTLEDWIERVLMNPWMASIMLMVTGLILFFTRYVYAFQKQLNSGRSFLIGISQALAIIPGISRSGATIATGLYLGIEREKVANFSFLMVIPVIAGAMLIKMLEIIEMGMPSTALMSLTIGFLTAFVSGYYALKYLIIILRNKGIHYFAYYCWLLGGFGIVYFSL